MSRSIRIPGLVDLKKIEDKGELAALAGDARLDRRFASLGPLVNRLLVGRVRGALQVHGKLLPAVLPRGDAERASTQAALRARLDPTAGPLWDEATLTGLVAAIREDAGAPAIGPAAQQAVGRLFAPAYVGDTESFAAAKDLDDAVHTRNPLRSIALNITGRLRRSRALLAQRVNGNTSGVHATGIAVHNLVRGFERMRELWRSGAPRPTPDEAARRCLFAPETVLRQATERGDTAAGEVRPGTLVLFELDELRAREATPDVVFMAGTWAECPAAGFVPALLRAVWEQALATEARA